MPTNNKNNIHVCKESSSDSVIPHNGTGNILATLDYNAMVCVHDGKIPHVQALIKCRQGSPAMSETRQTLTN